MHHCSASSARQIWFIVLAAPARTCMVDQTDAGWRTLISTVGVPVPPQSQTTGCAMPGTGLDVPIETRGRRGRQRRLGGATRCLAGFAEEHDGRADGSQAGRQPAAGRRARRRCRRGYGSGSGCSGDCAGRQRTSITSVSLAVRCRPSTFCVDDHFRDQPSSWRDHLVREVTGRRGSCCVSIRAVIAGDSGLAAPSLRPDSASSIK